jgi:hypothetical protein
MIGVRIGVKSEQKGGLAFSIFYTYQARVEADGGVVEGKSCAIFAMNSL